MNNLLEINNLTKKFKGFQLNDVSFSLPQGYIMGVVGPNGAGKTTIIKLILNILKKDNGQILVFDKDNIEFESLIKQNIGVVFDSMFYVDDWTVVDTEKAVSMFYNNWDHDTYIKMIERFELPKNKKIRDFSKGMQMKLMLACAFSHDAKLLILDEPTSGLDPVTRDEFLEILQEYIKDGDRSVLFSTHITTDLKQVADFITVLIKGKVIYTGSMEQLLEKYCMIKGSIHELNDELNKQIYGIRKTSMGYEGLIEAKYKNDYHNCFYENATIDDIVIYLSKKE